MRRPVVWAGKLRNLSHFSPGLCKSGDAPKYNAVSALKATRGSGVPAVTILLFGERVHVPSEKRIMEPCCPPGRSPLSLMIK